MLMQSRQEGIWGFLAINTRFLKYTLKKKYQCHFLKFDQVKVDVSYRKSVKVSSSDQYFKNYLNSVTSKTHSVSQAVKIWPQEICVRKFIYYTK